MHDNARGGDDTLISGTGTDHMWGDAQLINDVVASPTAATGSVVTGADTFVFAPGNGDDNVHDFRQSDHDRIDVSAYGFDSLADMTIIDTGADTRIEFDATNSVTLVGFGDPGVSAGVRLHICLILLPPGCRPEAALRPLLRQAAERAAEADHAAHLVGLDLGQPAGMEPVQAPADQPDPGEERTKPLFLFADDCQALRFAAASLPRST